MNVKTILITGASSGIGLACVKSALTQDFNVIGISRRKPPINHENFTAIQMDLSETEQLESKFKNLSKQNPNISIIICAAGLGQFTGLESFSKHNIDTILNVNFTANALLIKTFLPALKALQDGKIILIGSESALNGGKQGSIYCASKFALRGFSQSLRQECSKHNIAVSLINPGVTRTEFFDKLNFRPGPKPQHAIDPQLVAQCLQLIINTPNTSVIEEIQLQPMQKLISTVKD